MDLFTKWNDCDIFHTNVLLPLLDINSGIANEIVTIRRNRGYGNTYSVFNFYRKSRLRKAENINCRNFNSQQK